ncbi:Zinc finger C2H2-type,U1-C, C2H2-type zinc finger,Zinc finger, CCCH-type [Cinara cedri]|uniref:Zinc finger C2H2-type,U1-C, C2H2-type zinc finger,Zinc finger, CCCH-type n=1 Tax=Cinara cedri TaxID=506608 RepID=A0A5E4MPA9_9HEMI|nr:Zinc finger C2H2-type,U1-C, C2H2-type zinc finger,Zinc finger, CCCH-type [Cinara cedri]
MVKKILCEYCNITFADNLSSRKLHLNSNAHHKNRSNYYSLYKDAVTLFLEERQKQPCRRFRTTGQCQYGSSCNFSHYTFEQLIHLINQENEKNNCKQVEKINAIPSIDSWLVKYQQNLYIKTTGSETNTKNIQLNHLFKNLPSLMPIVDADRLKNITLNTWS